MEIDKKTEYYNVENESLKVTTIEPKKNIKWNININQKAIIENKLNINFTDAAIFDFVYNFIASGNATSISIEGKLYHWIAYKYIINSMPLLEIKNKEVIARHIQKLCDCNLLEKVVSFEMGNKTFFKIGEKASCLFFDKIEDYPIDSNHTLSTQKSEAIDSKVDTLSTQKSNNSYIKDTYINNKDRETKIAYRENVTLKEKEYKGLIEKYGKDKTDRLLNKLSAYKLQFDKKYKSDYGAINSWVIESLKESQPKKHWSDTVLYGEPKL